MSKLCDIGRGFNERGLERDRVFFMMEGDKEKQLHIEVQKWLRKIE